MTIFFIFNLFFNFKLLIGLPSQHSVQKLSSICGNSSQDMIPDLCFDGSRKTSLVMRSMASPLLHRTAANDDCRSCVNWAGVKTAGSSYQNLQINNSAFETRIFQSTCRRL